MYEDDISPERRKEYQDAFEMFDKDKDGAITAKELGIMFMLFLRVYCKPKKTTKKISKSFIR